LGGHPHVLQGIEFYRNKAAVYNMGDLIFDYSPTFFTNATRQIFLFGHILDRASISKLHALPCRGGKFNAPAFLSPLRNEVPRIINLLSKLIDPFGTQFRSEKGRVAIIPPKEGKNKQKQGFQSQHSAPNNRKDMPQMS